MDKDYQRLFQTLGSPAMPRGLGDTILARVDNEVRRASLIRLAIFVPLVFVSSVATVVSFQYLMRETVQSGFSEYFSILFSDGGTVLLYWKEFMLALVEQAPVFGATLFLGAVFALMGSLKSMVKNIQTVSHHIQLAH